MYALFPYFGFIPGFIPNVSCVVSYPVSYLVFHLRFHGLQICSPCEGSFSPCTGTRKKKPPEAVFFVRGAKCIGRVFFPRGRVFIVRVRTVFFPRGAQEVFFPRQWVFVSRGARKGFFCACVGIFVRCGPPMDPSMHSSNHHSLFHASINPDHHSPLHPSMQLVRLAHNG